MVNTKNQPLSQRENNLQVHVLSSLNQPGYPLINALEQEGITWAFGNEESRDKAPNALIVDLTAPDILNQDIPQIFTQRKIPILIAVGRDQLRIVNSGIEYDDFFVLPCIKGEITARVLRLLELGQPSPAPGVIYADDLVIDKNRYDVYLAGKPVLLTFKEYELLKLLASNPGRVYGREALLEQVWGYAYFGGTRTVDVHVRRLRSKIEDANHTFIDTVWNVGYRFSTEKKQAD
ncbi:MAG: response regulator transcription factor [Gammaproteobacteria bacterium]|nr:response regulator transcription factor [Gammaproteobacteria bacterium]